MKLRREKNKFPFKVEKGVTRKSDKNVCRPRRGGEREIETELE